MQLWTLGYSVFFLDHLLKPALEHAQFVLTQQYALCFTAVLLHVWWTESTTDYTTLHCNYVCSKYAREKKSCILLSIFALCRWLYSLYCVMSLVYVTVHPPYYQECIVIYRIHCLYINEKWKFETLRHAIIIMQLQIHARQDDKQAIFSQCVYVHARVCSFDIGFAGALSRWPSLSK